jgi:hypothetical protein
MQQNLEDFMQKSTHNTAQNRIQVKQPRFWGLFLLALLMAVSLAVPQAAMAQQVTATVTGNITDASGAAVAGAKIVATDKARGTDYPATTNSEGYYRIPEIPASTYTIKAEAP